MYYYPTKTNGYQKVYYKSFLISVTDNLQLLSIGMHT